MSGGDHRPVLNLTRPPLDNILEAISVAALVAVALLIIHYWPGLPARIPVHFGPDGQPDSWGGKESLYLLPAIGILMYLTFTILYHFPRTYNYPVKLTEQNMARQYLLARSYMQLLKAEILWLFYYVELYSIKVALAQSSSLGVAFLPITLVIVFGSLAVYIYLARRSR
jgi:uncharacterized membrane protein